MVDVSLLVLIVLFLMTALLSFNRYRGEGKHISDIGQHIQIVGK
jgi:predicted small secreted protein